VANAGKKEGKGGKELGCIPPPPFDTQHQHGCSTLFWPRLSAGSIRPSCGSEPTPTLSRFKSRYCHHYRRGLPPQRACHTSSSLPFSQPVSTANTCHLSIFITFHCTIAWCMYPSPPPPHTFLLGFFRVILFSVLLC
jgi:hypothetical protein